MWGGGERRTLGELQDGRPLLAFAARQEKVQAHLDEEAPNQGEEVQDHQRGQGLLMSMYDLKVVPTRSNKQGRSRHCSSSSGSLRTTTKVSSAGRRFVIHLKSPPLRDSIPSISLSAWVVKYDFQLIGQSEDAKIRSLPKGGIEHRQYLRLKNAVSERQGISTAGRPPGGTGEDMPNLDFSQCCANSVAN